jgi:cytoskeleton protein RodZ
MASVGAYLRGLREKQGTSIDELSRATRVLHHYLEALEADNIEALPAPVFTKGFIRAYCQAVGVPPEAALKLYDRMGVPAPDVTKVPIGATRAASLPPIHGRQIVQEPDYLPATPTGLPPQGQPREQRARGTLLVSFVLLVVLGVAFFAVTLALQSGRQGDVDASARAPLPQPPVTSEAPAASPMTAALESPAPQPAGATQLAKLSQSATPSAPAPTVAPAAPSVPAAPKPPAPPSAAAAANAQTLPVAASAPAAVTGPGAAPSTTAAPALPAAPPAAIAAATTARGLGLPYRLIARTTETTWMRVRTEDGRTSEETIPANEIREWISNGPFIITIGNAGGVSLELNGRPIPRLGASGAVITRLVLPSDNP